MKDVISIDFDNINIFARSCAAGTIRPVNDFKYESASFQVFYFIKLLCLNEIGIILFGSYFQFFRRVVREEKCGYALFTQVLSIGLFYI